MTEADIFFFVVVLSLSVVFACACAFFASDRFWRQEAIKRGFAEYDSVTGKWRWKEPGQSEGKWLWKEPGTLRRAPPV